MSNFAHALLSIAGFAVWALMIVIFVQIILSWLILFNVINTHNGFISQLFEFLDRITEPFYRPIRRFLPDFGGIDFSPLIVLLLLNLLLSLIGDLQYQALLA
ncbi:YggT family protein [Parasphingopyxis sp.]|uniref:YggT family protein n=1 Tax=Parasphingopyxis sp. TaxID=1920299 RepID=UPI00261381DA|nr:YggT family protein [Parasphingopyxis sp.]